MIKKSAILISAISITLIISPVFAKDSSISSTTRPNLQQRINTKLASREANLANRMENQMELMNKWREQEATREAFFKLKMMNRDEKIASEEAKFKLRLEQFKDKQKAQIADRVNTNLNKINQNQTTQMTDNLNRMSAVLDKLGTLLSQNSPEVTNSDALGQAMTNAKNAISSSITTVQAQALKDYTISVTSESQVKTDAQSKRDQLFKDIMAVRKMVIDAKQQTSDAVSIARSGLTQATSSAQTKEGTVSGQQ